MKRTGTLLVLKKVFPDVSFYHILQRIVVKRTDGGKKKVEMEGESFQEVPLLSLPLHVI